MGEITWGTAAATLAAPFVFVLPGWALLSLLLPQTSEPLERPLDGASRLILAAGLTVALVPVLLLLLYLLGWSIGPGVALGILGLSAAIVVARQGPGWRRVWAQTSSRRERLGRIDAPLIALILVTVLIVVSRLWPVRGVNYGLWGDSYQHTMIAQLILDRGGLFQSWAPYAPLRTFTYHFGFHSAVAWFQWATEWLTGYATPRTVVLVGQVLNVLAALSLYPLTVRLSGRRWAGVGAVLVAALLMPMPAYFVNWGRYTQLTAQVLLPVALWLLLEALEPPTAGPRTWLLAGLALGGLGLTHYRVTAFAPCFLLPYLLGRLIKGRSKGGHLGRMSLGLAVSGGLAALIVAPWLWNLFRGAYPTIVADVVADPNTAQSLSQTYLYRDFSQWMPWSLVGLALLGAGLALGQRRAMTLVTAWTALLFLLANPHWIGLAGTGLVDNFTVILGLYMPASMLIGYLGGEGLEWAARRLPGAQAVALALFLIVGGAGVVDQADVLDPESQIMTAADEAAMGWIREHTPADARFLVNGLLAFSDQFVAGSDGGWWIPLLTGRGNTIPPLSYASEGAVDPEYVQNVRALYRTVNENDLGDPATVAWLQGQGITHVYVGAQGGGVNDADAPLLDLEILQSSPYYRAVYSEKGVWIFALSPPGGTGD